jgi:serine/threonine protein kinase
MMTMQDENETAAVVVAAADGAADDDGSSSSSRYVSVRLVSSPDDCLLVGHEPLPAAAEISTITDCRGAPTSRGHSRGCPADIIIPTLITTAACTCISTSSHHHQLQQYQQQTMTTTEKNNNGDEETTTAAAVEAAEKGRRREEVHQRQQQEQEQEELFKVIGGLGMGGFGTVVKVEEVASSKSLSMKVLPKKERRSAASLACELMVLKALKNKEPNSPFVQCLHGAYENSNNFFIVSDFIAGGDAFYYLSKRTHFSENQVKIILGELYLALSHVHASGYIHCDVKAENIMFDHNGHVKLVDFGLATTLLEPLLSLQQPMRVAGSLPYMAPELLYEGVGGRHTDWWAFGVFAYELLTGCCPWRTFGVSKVMTMEEIFHREVQLPRCFSREARDFIVLILQKNFMWRIGTLQDSDMKRAQFFRTINWEKLAKVQYPGAIHPGFVVSCTNSQDRDRAMNAFVEYMSVGRSSPLANLEQLQLNSELLNQSLLLSTSGCELKLKQMHVYNDTESKMGARQNMFYCCAPFSP